jgi:peptide-methionine (S)-S-oxide reductase
MSLRAAGAFRLGKLVGRLLGGRTARWRRASLVHIWVVASFGSMMGTDKAAGTTLAANQRRTDMTVATERAVLAGGCFWGVQDLVRRYPGVISTRVGYTGGEVPNATYRNHGNHAEAIEIIFDPQIISYRRLLEFFFQIHDPSTLNRQGNDRGASYRSAIFYTSDEQKKIAEDTIADVDASGLWPGKVVTEVTPAGPFWEAEPEHQDYLERYPDGYTCHFVRPNWTLPHRAEKAETGPHGVSAA